MRKYWIVILGLLLLSCHAGAPDGQGVKRSIMVWHVWNDKETQVLEELFDKFSSIYPNVTVIQERFPIEELPSRFMAQARLGLGPDVLILPGRFVREFADAGLIQPIDTPHIDSSIYLSSAVNALRYRQALYGLPLSLHTYALYYNTSMVSEPPATLQALLEQAEDEKPVALNTDFYAAFWGIQAFGGQAFDETGRVTLDRGGFANWLNWLKKAQNVPNILLSNDDRLLYNFFTQKRVAYYTASSERLLDLQEKMGEDAIGVAPLPAGPNNPSGPILEVEAMCLNAASSPSQTELAASLMQFLTNFEQQMELVRQLHRVPANSRVWIDRRAYPVVAGFAAQTKTAVALPNIPQIADVAQAGNEVYIQTLAGVKDTRNAVREMTEQVNDRYGFGAADVAANVSCHAEGAIRVWYLPREMDGAFMENVRQNFMRQCPNATIELTALDNLDDSEIVAKYTEALNQENRPDLLLGSNRITALLAADNALRDLNDLVEPEFLQQYIPEILEAMSYDGKLYGLPMDILELTVLYYNRELVPDPPLILEDLLNQASPERLAILPYGFYHAYWGLQGFGAKLFDREFRVSLDSGGFTQWLGWLKTAREHPGIMLVDPYQPIDDAKKLFTDGKAAYFVGDVDGLQELETALGKDRLRVVPLPAGPKGKSGPILGVGGFMLNPKSDRTSVQLAIEFAKYAAGMQSQTLLMQQTHQIPANVNVDTTDYPVIAGFLEQAQTAVVLPFVPQLDAVIAWGEAPYKNVLEQEIRPTTAADNFVALTNKANGFPLKTPEPSTICQGKGSILLWHSWSGERAAALKQVMANFMAICSDIRIEAKFVPAASLPEQLTAAVQEDTAPDLVLASHTIGDQLQHDGVIKNIKSLADDTVLVQYRPGSLDAVESHHHTQFYGLPVSCDTTVLYYNTKLVSEPPQTLADLLTAATPKTPVAIDVSFSGAFWGISAVGGQILDSQGQFAVNQSGFVEWLTWLKTAQTHPGIVLNADQSALRKLFASGKAAYIITGSDAFHRFKATLGIENVGVAPLPPASGEYTSIAFSEIDALMFPSTSDEEDTRIAVAFAAYAASDKSQTLFMNNASLIPTNQLTIVDIETPALQNLSDAFTSSIIMPDRSAMERLKVPGEKIYQDVLSGTVMPEEAVNAFMQAIGQQPETEENKRIPEHPVM